MEKYTFNKDYETQVRTASLEGVGTGTRQIKIAKGINVEGEILSKGLVNIKYEELNLSVDSSYLDLAVIKEVLEPKKEPIKTNIKVNTKPSINKLSTTIFTTRNITITVVILALTVGILKYKKLI